MRAFLSREMLEFGYPERFEPRKSRKTNVVFGLHVGGFGCVFRTLTSFAGSQGVRRGLGGPEDDIYNDGVYAPQLQQLNTAPVTYHQTSPPPARESRLGGG